MSQDTTHQIIHGRYYAIRIRERAVLRIGSSIRINEIAKSGFEKVDRVRSTRLTARRVK